MTKQPAGWRTFKQNGLFRGDRNRTQYNACVGDNGGPYDLFDYALGYFEATDALLKAVTKDKEVTLDIIVYPICLNFRHAMELFIKYLISDLSKLAKSHSKFRPTHSLVENWRVAKELIKKTKLGIDPKELEWITQVVADIMEVDPKGEIFRYPESIKGDQHLKDWSLINLAIVGEIFAETKEIAERWQGKIEDRIEDAIQRSAV
jgi:hypothetical protein